jgi:hypothetical protein
MRAASAFVCGKGRISRIVVCIYIKLKDSKLHPPKNFECLGGKEASHTNLLIRPKRFASCDPTLATMERNADSSTSLCFAQNDSREGGATNFVFIQSGQINRAGLTSLNAMRRDAQMLSAPRRRDGPGRRNSFFAKIKSARFPWERMTGSTVPGSSGRLFLPGYTGFQQAQIPASNGEY